MIEISELKVHLDSRLDKIEVKLDNHLERIATAETDLSWLKGHAKIVVSLVLTALSGLAIVVYQLVMHKG